MAFFSCSYRYLFKKKAAWCEHLYSFWCESSFKCFSNWAPRVLKSSSEGKARSQHGAVGLGGESLACQPPTLTRVKQASAESASVMMGSCSALYRTSRAPGPPRLQPASQPTGVGDCLFSLLNLTNTNTVNFISEGGSCSIVYEPPVSSPKPPLCLPVCVLCTHFHPCAHEPTYS